MKSKDVRETKSCYMRIDAEGILRMTIKQGARIDAEEVKKVYGVVKEISEGKKVLELMEGSNFYTFDLGGQKYAAKHGKDHFIASAIILNSAGMRMLFNFFSSFIKQPVPFKMFSNETEALKWLRTFKEK